MTDTSIVLSPRVTYAGSPLATAWQIALLELKVERALNVPGRVTLRFADPGYALLQSGTISLEHTTSPLVVTDPGGDHTLFQGRVTAIGSDQREGEQPELVVVGHDLSYKLGLTSGVKTWVKVHVATIVNDLVSSVGMTASFGPSANAVMLDYLLQVDTDLGLLGELARRTGADWWVDGSTLYFGVSNELASERSTTPLTLGGGLLSFSVRAVAPPSSVSVVGWDTVQQQTVTTAKSSATTGVMPTSDIAKLAPPAGQFLAAAAAARSVEEAGVLSQALFDQRAASAVEASGTAAGAGQMEPGGQVTVKGAGPLSGTYPLTAVEHLYRPRRGFVTRFWSGDRRPAGLADAVRDTSAGMAGSIVGHRGVTAGIVTNINDPTNLGRVKVKFPGLSSTQESAWARIVAPGGGVSRGNVFIPEVGDEVLVAFEDGDTRTPVVIGGLYGKQSTIPPPALTNGKVQKRELVSRLGHVISFLDGSATATKAIELVLAGQQNKIHLGADKTTVTVQSGNELTVTVGSTTITVAKGTGAVSVKAPSVQIQATQQLQLSAPQIQITSDGTMTLSSKGQLTVTGAMVDVQSKSALSITGSPVMINS